jgi:hypothetical protein
MKQLSSLHELRIRAEDGQKDAQQLCVIALQNIGAEHLASISKLDPEWMRAYDGIVRCAMARVVRYGRSPADSFAGVIEDVNCCIDCLPSDDLSEALDATDGELES